MNRLVIIGNGFDLAHGLKTSYKDFMNWYAKDYVLKMCSVISKEYNDGLCRVNYDFALAAFQNCLDRIEKINDLKRHSTTITITKTSLLGKIETNLEYKNWVDIEDDYYQLLKEIILSKNSKDYKVKKVTELNDQLENLKKKLIEYLCGVESNAKKYNEVDVNSIICSNINIVHDLDSRSTNIISEENQGSQEIEPENTIILNFNYTNTIKMYCDENNLDCLHIHGKLENPGTIVFGYGDEFDEDYKIISNANENVYLEKFKSFKYLENSTYKEVLRFIESDKFQILLLGHSCGNSDRTLLSTLFNHKNCVSIKPYYHLKENGKDDYSDLIMNISRSFNSASEMRSKVVSKEHCLPLR